MILSVNGHEPDTGRAHFVAENATVIGAVRLDSESSIWYSATLRAETEPIIIGARSNLQDGSVVHTDPGFPATVGVGVTVGHRAVLHGCRIEDEVLIGMGAIIMDGAVIGSHSLIAAGTVVTGGTIIPAGSLVAGVPGVVRRDLSAAERSHVVEAAGVYVRLSKQHAAAIRRH